MKIRRIILFVLAAALNFYPQMFTNWKNYTDMKNVSDLSTYSAGVWAATGGGVFHYSGLDDSFTTLNKADGLEGIAVTSVVIDQNGKIWFGSQDGIIDVYDTEEKEFKVILDIFNSSQINKKINDLNYTGDTIIVSTDFGISLIDNASYLFFDTFFKFGNFPSNTKVNSSAKLGLMYACTDAGLAVQKQGAQNLSAPESWNVYTIADGLPSNKTFEAGIYNSSIIVSTDKGFAVQQDTAWIPFISELNQKVINDFQINSDTIIILSENKIYRYLNSQLTEIDSSNSNAVKLSFTNGFGIAVATNCGVLRIPDAGTVSILIPNGPAANQFPSMSVDQSGVLYSASGKDNLGAGFYTYDKSIWRNFNTGNTPSLPTNDIYYSSSLPGNTNYLGTWGSGFIKVIDNQITHFNRSNTGMQGIPNSPEFLVITGFARDSQGNTWVLNYWAGDRNTLSLTTPDNVWYHFIVPAEPSISLQGKYNLAIDQYDTKWYYLSSTSTAGLYYFNENKTFENPADDKSDYISTIDGLNSNTIRSIVVDRRGEVWVGTSIGVNVISNTSTIPSSSNPQLRISSVFAVRQQSVNAIAVDPLNQKWIGTSEGLLLLNSDGSRLLAALNSDNSPLLSDQIQSIAIDENSGIIYIGTDEGLTSFETPYIKPLENFEELFVYPNPFYLKDNSKLLTIDGLIKDTEIKILSLSGKLISEFSSPGGRTAYWDGTDSHGNIVGTGIYLIVAFDQEGNSVITGKVAVVRE